MAHSIEKAQETNVQKSTWTTKAGLARMLKGGVIMDVVTPDQARLAEESGRRAVSPA
jgi:pyridoxal 5'-phosphate synthase pdxS subunit